MSAAKKAEAAKELFELLYETAVNAGIEVIEDRINRKGGVCRVREKLMVVYDAHATIPERNRLILEAIAQMNVDFVYLPPRIRELLERSGEEKARAEEDGS
ncbi:MAG TPA: hypothetical protein PKM41_11785 [Deltaproteobacteria bacterium]|jgi:hypothetical protein|nr:hypothetical protein [Deltaproteobacteria bacterium]HOI07839.1 hypothetical protein [Deltaproteobacteria bacterium]